jgi:hypothetical protein
MPAAPAPMMTTSYGPVEVGVGVGTDEFVPPQPASALVTKPAAPDAIKERRENESTPILATILSVG